MSAEKSPDCSGAGEILPEDYECKIHSFKREGVPVYKLFATVL
jgi:hypothetical protein